MKRLCLLAALLLPTAAIANFDPVTVGWWQLQDPSNYSEICTASSAVCDPEPGTYKLIDFGTSPVTHTMVTIEGELEPATLVDMREFVTRETYTNQQLSITAEAVCSGGAGEKIAVMGSCSATVNGLAVPIRSQGESQSNGVSAWNCQTNIPAVFSVHALCITTGTSSSEE